MRYVIKSPHPHGVDQIVGRSLPVCLNKVCPGGIAEATGALSVEGEWSGTLQQAIQSVTEGCSILHEDDRSSRCGRRKRGSLF
jgi:hypothetical protein